MMIEASGGQMMTKAREMMIQARQMMIEGSGGQMMAADGNIQPMTITGNMRSNSRS